MKLHIGLGLALVCSTAFGQAPSALRFLVSNNDAAPFESGVTFYGIATDGIPFRVAAVTTGGTGVAGGDFAESRVVVVPVNGDLCVFASDGGTGDIAGIDAKTRTLTGNFLASPSDLGSTNGIGLATNTSYLYASYSTSSTIATFQIQSGCTLNYVSDLFAVGLNQGWVTGMAIHGAMMVVTYGDGSIGSFNISAGPPVANNDEQYSTGYADDHLPNGVEITKDGHFAIFGDSSTVATVEVSDISSGLLTPTVPYNIGIGWNSASVRLSPDESILFVSNNSSGQVTAAPFNKTTGNVSSGCTSASLKGFYNQWSFSGDVALQLPSGSGGLLYVPEFGSNGTSSIGVVQFSASGTSCTLTETPNSPVSNATDIAALLSIATFPSRAF